MSKTPKTIDEWAMEHAMLARQGHQSGKFSPDQAEAEMDRIETQMGALFGEYATQEAIKRANIITAMVGIHSDEPDREEIS